MNLQLGIIYDEKNKIINHRSLVKVILNPFLRLVKINIATIYDKNKNILLNPKIVRCKFSKNICFKYNNSNEYKIEKRRRII